MRIIVPYTTLHPRFRLRMDASKAMPVDFHNLNGDDTAYFRLLRDLWASGEGFMLVEHDMELNGGEVEAFEKCPNPWCTFPYEGSQPIYTSRRMQEQPRARRIFRCALGCTRFRAELCAELPDALTRLERLSHPWGDNYPNTHWRRIDSQLASFLFQHGKKVCEHEPHVIHHHDYDRDPVYVR